MARVAADVAGRELYALLERDPPGAEEWRALQARWAGLFAAPPATPEGYPPDLPVIDVFHQLGPKGA